MRPRSLFSQDFKEYHTDSTVHFVISLSAENMAIAEAEGLEKRFKLSTTITTSNMVCFDREGRIRRYNMVDEILRDFFPLRLEYYMKRKVWREDRCASLGRHARSLTAGPCGAAFCVRVGVRPRRHRTTCWTS